MTKKPWNAGKSIGQETEDEYSDAEIQEICEREAIIFNYFPEPDLFDILKNKDLPF